MGEGRRRREFPEAFKREAVERVRKRPGFLLCRRRRYGEMMSTRR